LEKNLHGGRVSFFVVPEFPLAKEDDPDENGPPPNGLLLCGWDEKAPKGDGAGAEAVALPPNGFEAAPNGFDAAPNGEGVDWLPNGEGVAVLPPPNGLLCDWNGLDCAPNAPLDDACVCADANGVVEVAVPKDDFPQFEDENGLLVVPELPPHELFCVSSSPSIIELPNGDAFGEFVWPKEDGD
jgi:hypothetical protein